MSKSGGKGFYATRDGSCVPTNSTPLSPPMASPDGNPTANPNNLSSPFDIWMLFSSPHNQPPPIASPARNPNRNLNNPIPLFDIGMPFDQPHNQLPPMASPAVAPGLNFNNPILPFDIGMTFNPPHNQLPPMASSAIVPDLNFNNPNLPVDTGVLFRPTHNPTPTAASMYPGSAGQPWLSSPDIYPLTAHFFNHGPHLHYAEDPQPSMPHPDISFPMLNPNTNLVQSGNPAAPYLHYAQDLQTFVPRPDISFPMSNPNQSGSTAGPYLHYTQGLQNPMPQPVTSLPMPNRCANPNRSGAIPNWHRLLYGAQNGTQKEVIPISDSESDFESEDLSEETPIHSKSNGKASSGSLKTGGKASSGSLKTGGKASSFSEGEAGKGGKAFSAGKGGKGSTSNAKPAKSDAELKLELDMPPNSRILMNCEAAEMLQQIHEHMAILSEDPKIKIPESFDKAFQYAKEGNHFTTAKSVEEILQPLKIHGVTDGEICMIANIGPETIEEVYALVPSLKATRSINEGLITEALAALANIKASK